MYKIFEELCTSRNVTPYRVGKETGIATSTFSDWKNGKSTPKTDKLQKIADFFMVTVDYLLTGKTTEEKIKEEFSPEQSELDLRISQDLELKSAISKYFSLSDKKKQHVIELIELLSGEE